LALCSTLAAFADHKETQTDSKDASFIKEAARGGQAEIQLGKMGAEKGQHSQIKQLGQRLEQDHSKANQELIPIAQKCGVNLPTDMSWMEKLETKNLESKTGADFDKAFAEHTIKDHEKDIDRFQKALPDCKEPDLKAFIEKTLPVLRQHLQMARSAGSAVGLDEKILASADPFLSDQSVRMSGTVDKNQVDRTGIGTAPGSEAGNATGGLISRTPSDRLSTGDIKHPAYADLPVAVQNVLRADGDPQAIRDVKTTTRKGQLIYIIKTQRDGKNVTLRVAEDGTLQKGNWFSRLLER